MHRSYKGYVILISPSIRTNTEKIFSAKKVNHFNLVNVLLKVINFISSLTVVR